VVAGFTLEEVNHERKYVWYRLPAEFSPSITKSCDPFVLAALFKAMNTPADLVVHGEVSPSLLFNLDEFQAAWTSWIPKQYSRIEIIPDNEQERSAPDTPNAVMAFSGGVDSCFTAWRYRKENGEQLPYLLQAGVLIQGLEIPLKFESTFDNAVRRSNRILDSLGMDLIPMVTNQRIIHLGMMDTMAAFLVSCLMLLQDGYAAGLIASSYCYAHIFLPYATNPLTDHMLSSGTFPILHDGAKYNRINKLAMIAEWPEAMQYLRVCHGKKAEERDKNCCRCEKCVRNILESRALGLGLPKSFEKDLTFWQILKLQYSYETGAGFIYEDIISAATERRISDSWVRALKISIFLNRLRIRAERVPWFDRVVKGLKRIKKVIGL